MLYAMLLVSLFIAIMGHELGHAYAMVKCGIAVKEIYWDNRNRYWLEVSGERISYDGALAPLEFKR